MTKPVVRLRAMEGADVDMMYELENDTTMCTTSSSTAQYSRDTLRQFINTTTNDVFADHQLRMVIDVDGQPAGCADLCNVDAVGSHAEVSMGLLPRYRGCGVGRMAMGQLVDYATNMLGLRTLIGIVNTTNLSCMQMMQSVGFVPKGKLTGWIRNANEFQDAIIYQYVQREQHN